MTGFSGISASIIDGRFWDQSMLYLPLLLKLGTPSKWLVSAIRIFIILYPLSYIHMLTAFLHILIFSYEQHF